MINKTGFVNYSVYEYEEKEKKANSNISMRLNRKYE